MKRTKHLDIGCGSKPRNPYHHDELHGVDIIEQTNADFHYKRCNVTQHSLPYDNSFFDSVSAYDFLEHIPRFAIIDNQAQFPFINFMNEAYRILKPDGIFYAITPCYPRAEAFVDPTHINFITSKTHTYFTGSNPGAGMYGFGGQFEIIKIKRIKFSQGLDNNYSWFTKFMKDIVYTIYYTKKSHILWELKAVKE